MLKPYYQDDLTTIYHGDCTEILPQLDFVDLVLTDPPYGIGADNLAHKQGGTQYGKAAAAKKQYLQSDWDADRISPELLKLVLGAGKNLIVWGGNYYTDILAQNVCWLVWDKKNGQNNFADCELAWTNLPGSVRLKTYMWNGMLKQKPEDRFHPTQKPLEVMSWCVNQAEAKAGEIQTILDPFMGSGTTLRAGKDMGKRVIGIERMEQYCEIAAKRMAQEVLPFFNLGEH